MKHLYILVFLFVCSAIHAQKILILDNAISIALKNNFDISVERNQAEIARINNNAGNAGMLPTLQLTGAGNYSNNNVYQKNTNGTETTYPSLNSTNVNAGIELSWTLFDRGKMFVTKTKLHEIQTLGELQFQAKVLELTYNVIAAYYDIVRQNQQLKLINEMINYNKERVKISQTGFDAGSLLKTDFLQAKIDLNVATENAICQQFAIDASKKQLQILMAQNSDENFDVIETILSDYSPETHALKQKLNSSNASILAFQKQSEIARLVVKEHEKTYLPELNVQGGYYFSQTHNSDGNIEKNKEFGPQLGGSLTIPLYKGGQTNQKIAIAKLELQSAEYDLENIRLQLNVDFDKTISDFENQKRLLEIEKENNDLTKENLEICISRFRYGQTTSLEVHLAQENYVQSCTRLITFEYNLKLAETKLKQLVADL